MEKIFDLQEEQDPSSLFQSLQEVVQFLTPSAILDLQDDERTLHPSLQILTALADLEKFLHSFERKKKDEGELGSNKKSKRKNQVEAQQAWLKIRFYYALIIKLEEVDSNKMRELVEEVERSGRRVLGKWEMKNLGRRNERGKIKGSTENGRRKGAFIEELEEGIK